MKFLGVLVGCLLATAAQADFLSGLLNSAVSRANHERRVQKRSEEIFNQAWEIHKQAESLAETYAKELLDEASQLSVLAQASQGGHGKDLTYTEYKSISGVDKKLPCGADLFSTKNGVVTLTLVEKCDTVISLTDMRRKIERLGQGKAYCEKNMCQIDYSQRK